MDDLLGTVDRWTNSLSGVYERVQTAKLNVRLAEAKASEASLGLPNNRGTINPGAPGQNTAPIPTGLILLAGALMVFLALKD